MNTQAPPKLPPAWFKHAFWRGHRAVYRLSRGRFLWTPASKRGWRFVIGPSKQGRWELKQTLRGYNVLHPLRLPSINDPLNLSLSFSAESRPEHN